MYPTSIDDFFGRSTVVLPSLLEINMESPSGSSVKIPWNKGKIVGQKDPLKLKDIWAIRIRL